MIQLSTNKRKILNDPIYGFITLEFEILYDLIEHPYFQRLRRIQQLGLSHLVYPGALHTRFHHAIGAMHLMKGAVETLRIKGVEITKEEEEGALIAILLHDIGHGPYSHALEHSLVRNITHEEVSLLFMERLNAYFDQRLTLGIAIFTGNYEKYFLHQLVSSQLDMDRLDYLMRDSFYSGVSEGVVSSDRIISMLTLANGELAVEQKGIYSIEKFLVARRLMYWQVYLHKTVLVAEFMLVKIFNRAKQLVEMGKELFCSPALKRFLAHDYSRDDFRNKTEVLEYFSLLDDYDFLGAMKVWSRSSDRILAMLCGSIVNRRLWRIEIQKKPFEPEYLQHVLDVITEHMQVLEQDATYFLIEESITNNAYNPAMDKINILMKDGTTQDIREASDSLNISALAEPVKKYFVCYPKEIEDLIQWSR